MKLVEIFLCLLIFTITIQAGNNDINQCAGTIPQSSITASTGGLYKPSTNGSGEYMKALVVFVQFNNTDVDVNNSIWPKDQLPTWANNLISSSPSGSYPDFTISDYWKEMSTGSFDFIGDVYPNLVTINTEDYYSTNGHHFGECNKDALTQINPYVDFREYDNWRFNSSTNSFEFIPDNYVDMIIMIYRTPKNVGGWFDAGEGDFNAIAVLSGSGNEYTLNFDGVNILAKRSLEVLGSGLTIKKGIKSLEYTLPILAHEYGHYLFGYNHGNTGGIMSGNYSLSAVERERLGHLSYTNCTHNDYSINLDDFIMNGDVLRIPIPITNQNSTTFFLVENHQKLSKYDQIIRGGSIGGGYDYSNTGSGIYVWLVKNGNSSIPFVHYEALTADGRWDWTYDGDYYAGPGWYVGKSYEGYLPKTKRSSVNRNTGKSDRKKRSRLLEWSLGK
jgi:M6 family metalloprotease-like protein